MKKIKYIIFILIISGTALAQVDATSGRLRNNSIKTCNGITYGQHSDDNHWHVASRNSNGTYSATGSAIYSDPCKSNNNQSSNPPSNNNSSSNSNNNVNNQNTTTNNQENNPIPEETKSNDNTLKTITIDGNNIEISDNINYLTTNEKIDIEVTTNDDKATYEIKNKETLSIGENIIIIDVTAEDGTIKSYNITVTRNKILSSETGIEITINDQIVKFDNYKSTVYISSNEDTITFNSKLKDENAKIEMDEIPKLKTGDNIINIKVIAEDGTEQKYELIIHKYSEQTNIISNIITVLFIGLSGYGIYYLINKKKEI